MTIGFVVSVSALLVLGGVLIWAAASGWGSRVMRAFGRVIHNSLGMLGS